MVLSESVEISDLPSTVYRRPALVVLPWIAALSESQKQEEYN